MEESLPVVEEQPAHKRVGRASPTPAADDDGIYVFFTDIGLLALDFGGEPRWQATLGPFRGVYGISTSPVVTAGAVVLAADRTEGSFIAAFSKRDGEMLWRRDRPNGSGGYATPILIGGEATRILVSGSREVAIYDVQTGEMHWCLDGLPASSFNSPSTGAGMVYVSMASAPGQLSFSVLDRNGDGRIEGAELDGGPPGVLQSWAISAGDGDGALTPSEFLASGASLQSGRSTLFAIRLPTRTEDQGEKMIRWTRFKELPLAPSPLLYDDVLYLVKDGGILTALDPLSGAVLKQGRLRNAIDGYTASPVAADGRIVFASESGKLTVVRAGAEWEELTTHDLGETIYASPALAGDRVYVRTTDAIWCFGPETPR